MARKKIIEESENHERWLVSYADFITLLFAFFVVMYSMSSVNEGKYRVLSDSVSSAFQTAPTSSNPVQAGELTKATMASMPAVLEMAQPIQLSTFVIPRHNSAPVETPRQLENIAGDVEGAFEELIDEEQLSVRKTPLWLEIEINSSVLFTSASAVLSDDAEVILGTLGDLLNSYQNRVNVEGFTDNRPIQNSIYPSNWELSSARAAAVVRLFEGYGVEPSRMVSVGYGEFKPSSSNETETGRASNRKVVIVIMADNGNSDSAGELEQFRQRINN